MLVVRKEILKQCNIVQFRPKLNTFRNGSSLSAGFYFSLFCIISFQTLSKIIVILGNVIQSKSEFLYTTGTYQKFTGIFTSISVLFVQSIRSSISVDGSHIAIALRRIKTSRSVTFATKTNNRHGNISVLYENQAGAESWLKLPGTVFAGNTQVQSSVLFYEMGPTNLMPSLPNQTIVSNILSAKVVATSRQFEDLSEPIEIHFDVGRLTGVNVTCQYWDEKSGKFNRIYFVHPYNAGP